MPLFLVETAKIDEGLVRDFFRNRHTLKPACGLGLTTIGWSNDCRSLPNFAAVLGICGMDMRYILRI